MYAHVLSHIYKHIVTWKCLETWGKFHNAEKDAYVFLDSTNQGLLYQNL